MGTFSVYTHRWARGPVRQPYAGVNYIPQSGTMNLATVYKQHKQGVVGGRCQQKRNRAVTRQYGGGGLITILWVIMSRWSNLRIP
jgi:hypothetical protein